MKVAMAVPFSILMLSSTPAPWRHVELGGALVYSRDERYAFMRADFEFCF